MMSKLMRLSLLLIVVLCVGQAATGFAEIYMVWL